MYNYSNSLRDNFRSALDRVKDKSINNVASPSVSSNTVGYSAGISTGTPDYNVIMPVAYTKLGVKSLSNGQEIHCYKLSNGQRVYIAPKESAMTTLNTYVNTGSMNEKDDERGISHFCEHMAFNGTSGTDNYMKLGIGDVFRKVDKLGGYTNACTSQAETNYTISIPQFNEGDFETIVKMQSSMMNNLEMSAEMVEKEHGPVTSEINMYSDVPSSVVQHVAIKNLYNIQSTSNDVVAGTVDNILNIDRNKVMSYYKNNYFPANMVTVVTGDVEPDKAIEIISKNFRGQNPQNPDRRFEQLKPIEKTVRKDIFSNKAVATSGIVCFNGPTFNNAKDCLALSVVNEYLFNKNFSKTDTDLKDYNTSVKASFEKMSSNPKDGMLLSLSYDSTEENSEIVLRNIFNNLTNFKPPTLQEFENLKTKIKFANEKNYERTNDLNNMIGSAALLGDIDNVVDEPKLLDSLTIQDLVNVVQKYYNVNKASVAVIHPDLFDRNSVFENYKNAKSVSFTGAAILDNDVSAKNNKTRQPIDLSRVDRYKTNNNIEVALLKSKGDIANCSIILGTVAPPNVKPGVVSLLSTMLSRKTTKHKDFIDNNNISFNIGSSENSILFDSEVPSKNFAASMDLMRDLVFNPDFSLKNFEDSKKEIKEAISIIQPDAYSNALKDLFPEGTRGYTNKDVLDNIDKIEIGDVIGLYQYIIQNSSAVCAASLPTDKYPAIKNVFDNELASMQNFKHNSPRIFNDFKEIARSKVVKDTANTAQAEIVEIFKFYNDFTPKTRVINKLVTSILSRGDETGLFNNLREKEKLAYSVYASCDENKYSSSTLSCNIMTTTDSSDLKSYENVQKSIGGFNRQISKMVNGEFTDEEFETAKLNLKCALLKRYDSQECRVFNLADLMYQSPTGISEHNEMYKILDSITKEDVINGANRIFSNKPIYSIRASQKTLDANREYLDRLEG